MNSVEKSDMDDNLQIDESALNAKEESGNESDSEASDSDVQNLISHIFGDSDEEEEEFEGFKESDLSRTKNAHLQKAQRKIYRSLHFKRQKSWLKNRTILAFSSSEDEAQIESQTEQNEKVSFDHEVESLEINNKPEVYDFDLMMQRRKEESSSRKRKRDYEIINDSDDLIADIIQNMVRVAKEDRDLNKKRMPAIRKIKMLPVVASQMKKAGLKVAFLDQGVLSAMADWLKPLPDRSLPHLMIRETFLRLLGDLSFIDPSLLKSSGIGKAIMLLFKHPKETKENKKIASTLISEWARPLFNLKTDFHSLSREEREKRDFQQLPKCRKLKVNSSEECTSSKANLSLMMEDNENVPKPGEKGWIGRARVPKPSTREYVVRPKWTSDVDQFAQMPPRKKFSSLEKRIREFDNLKKKKVVKSSAKLSIVGDDK